MQLIITYFILINITTFFIYALDKKKARKNERRISERTLLTLAAIGGIFGGILGMILCRHKTAKTSFILKISLIVITQLAIVYYFSKSR